MTLLANDNGAIQLYQTLGVNVFFVLERQSLFVSAAARLSIYIKTSLEVQREMPLLVRYREFPIYASVIANKG